MQQWKPSDEQQESYERDGYFIVRGMVSPDEAAECRGVIKNTILKPDTSAGADVDPMDPMGESPGARAARFRKLMKAALTEPVLWHNVYTHPQILSVARHFLGGDLLLKFNSCFLKPALTGSVTPWHQDNGLWRDGESEPFNFWMALDPAIRENGCLQFIPGSHKTEIVEHVLYEDSIHCELPHERVDELAAKNGLHHIELQPGDAVCWHSNLWHYSPVNTSPKGRIGIAGVLSTPELALGNARFKTYHWLLKGGEICDSFPPVEFVAPGEPTKLSPTPRREMLRPTVGAGY